MSGAVRRAARRSPTWRARAGGLALGGVDGQQREGEDGEADDGGRDALAAAERLDGQVLGAVDAEQHDHEQEEHDDGAGVDDHLHGGEEVGVLGDEQHGDAEQGGDQREGGVHRVAVEHHPQRTGDAGPTGDEEDEELHQC